MMPAKVKVTIELLNELIDKAKRVKKLQAGRFIKGNRSDGQPIYHYPKITLNLLATKLDVSANYLTILKRRDPAFERALRHVGQPKSQLDGVVDEEPREGTKAYVELQNKRLQAKIDKLEKKAQQNRERNLTLKDTEQQIENLITSSEELVEENEKKRIKIVELDAVVMGLRMEKASLKNQLALRA